MQRSPRWPKTTSSTAMHLTRKRDLLKSEDLPSQTHLIIPDIHHKIQIVEEIRQSHPGIPAIFLGDYFDDFYDTPDDMRATCRWLRNSLENTSDVFLIGNHCFAYLSYELGVRWGSCSGWTPAKHGVFHEYFPGDLLLRQCRWMVDCQDWLITHAGVSNDLYRAFSKRRSKDDIFEWVANAQNALLAGVAHPALLAGFDRGGSQKTGGILWCDWNSFRPIPQFRQILGHTPGNDVRFKRGDVCLDTNLKDYGLLEDGKLTILPAGTHVR